MNLLQLVALRQLLMQLAGGHFRQLPHAEQENLTADRGNRQRFTYPMPRLAPQYGQTPPMARVSPFQSVRQGLVRQRDESLGDTPMNPMVLESLLATLLGQAPPGYFRESGR